MNTRTFICMLAAVVVTAACSSPKEKYTQPEFPKEESKTFELLSDDLVYGGVIHLYKYEDILVIVTYSTRSDCFVHLFSKDGNLLGDFVREGRGPKELSDASQSYMVGPTLYLMSCMTKTMLAVDVSKLMDKGNDAVYLLEAPDDSNWMAYAFPVSSGNTITVYDPKLKGDIPPYEHARICLYDSKGNIVSSYNESPYSDFSPRGRSFLEFAMACRAVSPDGKHLAISANVGAVLEIFSIDNEVKHVKTSYYVEPQFEEKGRDVLTNEKSIAGFGYLYGGNEHLFAIYDGKTSFKDKSKVRFRDIAIFDWNGKPQKLIKTDWSIDAIVTDDDGETFYAVVSDLDRRVYLARLR